MIHITRAAEQRVINQGKFIIRLLPLGRNTPEHNDHGIYQLGRIDHATLEGGMVVKMHLHQNDEILSYMRKGTMIHKDSKDNEIAVHNQYLMMMNAGSGFYHEESTPDDGETVEMLQIFMRPRADELTPDVQFHQLDEAYSTNQWRLIGGNDKTNAPLKINTEIEVYDMRIENATVPLPDFSNKAGYLYVFDGEVAISGATSTNLKKGDAVFLENETIPLQTNGKADLVFFILDKEAPFSRNGLFTK